MNLVHFLAAGVNGAASGTATFVLRGTASSAQAVMYNEFEGLTQPATNIVTLDANGAAEVYVDAYVDVEIKNSAGTTLRTVTVGNSDSTTEVQSTSFKGTDYDGSPANTVGEPITLRALLNKWITSAGAADWQVLVGGVATNFQAAFAGISGLIFNVKDPTYGALGDGVTDDTTAILAATVAAAGAPVYFPPGTYKITTLSLSSANITWVAAGSGAVVISGTTGSALISLTDNTNTAQKSFHGLSFTSSGAYDRLFLLEENQNVHFSDCSLDASQCSADVVACTSPAGFSRYSFSNCDIALGASTQRGLYNQAAAGERSISVQGCSLEVPSGFTGSIIVGADFNVTGSSFDASAVTSGSYYAVDAESQTVSGKYIGSFVGNRFMDGGSSGVVFKLTDITNNTVFIEDANTFDGFTIPTAEDADNPYYEVTDDSSFNTQIVLGSRVGRVINVVASSNTPNFPQAIMAETIVVDYDVGFNATFIPGDLQIISGLTLNVVFLNENASARDVSFFAVNATNKNESAVPSGGKAFCQYVTAHIDASTKLLLPIASAQSAT